MNLLKRRVAQTVLAAMAVLPVCARPLRAETFKNPLFISTGSTPASMNSADFNKDGKLDLVWQDSSFTLHILLGNGDGSFRTGQSIPLPTGIGGAITIADFNHDGKLDLLVGGGAPQGQIGVFLGNGDGTFQPILYSYFQAGGTNYATVVSFGVADFNGDGDLDLIATDALNDVIYVLLGNGTGSFTLKDTLPENGGAGQIFVADLNGDGHQDFVIHGNLGASATVFLGNGDGTFQPGVTYHGPDNISSLLLFDIEGDGHPDMVILDFAGGIDILHGNPDGTFAPVPVGGIGNTGGMQLMAIADLNGDGILDIAGLSELGVNILLGTGNLKYKPPVSYIAGGDNGVFVTGDFNNDGRLDFAIAAPGGIAIFLDRPDGTLNSANTYNVNEPATGVAIADFNGDHIPDIAVGVAAPNPRILLGKGDGTFEITSDTNSGASGSTSVTTIHTGDFDGDGRADLILGGNNSNGEVFYGNGDGTFTAPLDLHGYSVVGFSQTVVADFNRDHRSDAVITNYNSLDILLGQANRTFLVATSNLGVASQVEPAAGDFNNDGIPDLVANVGVTNLQPLLGKGDGTFRTGRLFSTELPGYSNLNAPEAIAVADFDGDGNADIITLISYPQVAEIFYGNGDGTFNGPFLLTLSAAYTQIVIADVNQDGKPDLVLSDGNIICVIHNEGNRAFGPEVHYLAGPVGNFAVQDLNGDGYPDIIVANGGLSSSSLSTVTVLLNNPNPTSVEGSVSASPEPSVYASPFTLTVSVTPLQSGFGTPTGTVTFELDGAFVSTVPLQNGVASCVVSSAPGAVQHTVTASYSGDSTFPASTFSATHTVVPLIYATSTTLAAAPNPAVTSRTITLTASVTSPGPLPNSALGFNGVVAFHDGSTNLGDAYLNANDQAIFDTPLLAAGTHTLTATYLGLGTIYPGNIGFALSASPGVSEVVTANATAAALNVVPSTAVVGAAVTLTASVSASAGTPAGAVVFYDGTSILDVQPLDVTGTAVFSAVFSDAGTHSITASYLANGVYAASNSQAFALVVNGTQTNPTTMILVAAPRGGGSPSITLKATLRARSRVPSGVVIFSEGNARIGQGKIGNDGNASFALQDPTAGMHYVTASYAGDSTFGASTASVAFNGTDPNAPDFQLGLSAISAILGDRQSASIPISVKALRGFDQDIALSCFAGQTDLSCTVAPAIVQGGSGNSVLQIESIRMQSGASNPAPRLLLGASAILLAPWPFLLGLKQRPRRLRLSLVWCLFVVGLALGCGNPSLETMPPSIRTQSITVVGTSIGESGITHTIRLSVTFKSS
jgi:hypothetical protein